MLSRTMEVSQNFKERMVWWNAKLNNLKLKIWQDPWLDFMVCWTVLDAYLTEMSQCNKDRDKLDYFYKNSSDFKNYLLSKWGLFSAYAIKLKELSPVYDMRPKPGREVYLNDPKKIEDTFEFVYQIRCNLFHGSKDLKNSRDAELVSRSDKFLRAVLIDGWMKE